MSKKYQNLTPVQHKIVLNNYISKSQLRKQLHEATTQRSGIAGQELMLSLKSKTWEMFLRLRCTVQVVTQEISKKKEKSREDHRDDIAREDQTTPKIPPQKQSPRSDFSPSSLRPITKSSHSELALNSPSLYLLY